jgi:hypothetical protein
MEQSTLFLAFAGSLWQEKLHNGCAPLGGAGIKTTLWEVARFLDSRGIGDPRQSTLGQPFLDTQFSDIMKRWKLEDPAARPQQVLPSSMVRVIAKTYRASHNPLNRAMGDLVVTAHFFLLRVGEYTLTCLRRGRCQLAIPLRKRDITFWKEGRCVPHDSPLDALAMADMVTVNLGNQKNGCCKDAKMNHAWSGNNAFDPVSSLAQLVHIVAGLPDDTLLGTFWEGTRLRQVTSQDILWAIRHVP